MTSSVAGFDDRHRLAAGGIRHVAVDEQLLARRVGSAVSLSLES